MKEFITRLIIAYLAMFGVILLVVPTSSPDPLETCDNVPPVYMENTVPYVPAPTPTSTPEPIPVVFQKVEACPWSTKTQKRISKICDKYDISFELLVSMAYTESRFDTDAVSPGGDSIGAWQVQPKTWSHVIRKLGYTTNDMYKAIPSAEVTCYIMRAHFKEFDNVHFALMAWNGGGSYAYRMIDSGSVSDYAIEISERAIRYERKREVVS